MSTRSAWPLRSRTAASPVSTQKSTQSRFALGVATAWILLVTTPASAAVGIGIAVTNPTPVAGGAAFAVTVTITNLDAALAASNVLMTYPLPASLRFQSLALVGLSAGAFNCIGPPVGANGTVSCSAVSLPASGSVVLTVVADIDPNTGPGVRTNTARVVSGGTQNSASVQQNIGNPATLALSIAATPSVATGGNVVYRIAVANNSNSGSGRAVTVFDTLPPGTSFVSLQGAGAFFGTCDFNPASLVVSCFAPEVPVGVHDINLILKVTSNPGNLGNSATLSATTGTVSGSPAIVNTIITN